MKKYALSLTALLFMGTAALAADVSWNGQWYTTVPLTMSVCGTTSGQNLQAGPIYSNSDAQAKCGWAVAAYNAKKNGTCSQLLSNLSPSQRVRARELKIFALQGCK